MKPPRSQTRSGFSLVEVTLALGITAFCILPLIGLLGVGHDANRSSVQQTTAATITTAISADLQAIVTTNKSPCFSLTIPASGSAKTTNFYVQEDGTPLLASDGTPLTTLSTSQPTFLATVVMTSVPSGTLRAGYARILITWPALPSQVTGSVPTRYTNSMDTLVALNPN